MLVSSRLVSLTGAALLAIASNTAHAAPCGNWSPNVSATAALNKESKAISVVWVAAGPAPCENSIYSTDPDWNSTNHMRLYWAEGSTAPSLPPTGSDYIELDKTAMGTTHFVHRSDKQYSYTLVACENSGCTRYYGDPDGDLEAYLNISNSATTEKESWVLYDITGESDVTSAVVPEDVDANAPHAFFYPDGWATGLSDRLSIYFSYSGDRSTASEIYYMTHDDTGWPTSSLNDPANWSTPELVAEGSKSFADDDYAADHPWAMLTRDDSGNKRLQLLVHSQHPTASYHRKIIQIESIDEEGNDFNLGCSGTSCTESFLSDSDGYVALDADGTSATDYVDQAQHSRIYWDYVADAIIDTDTDAPFMMFQMKRPTSGSCADAAGLDDIGWADSAWNSTTEEWEWTVETDGGSPDCPVAHIEDGHDNTMIPLPGGEFRMYYKDYASPYSIHVVYWDGGAWVDDTTIEIVWDGSALGPSHKCVNNVAAVIHPEGTGDPNEGLVFRLQDSNACGGGYTGFDDDGGIDESGIVFAELEN